MTTLTAADSALDLDAYRARAEAHLTDFLAEREAEAQSEQLPTLAVEALQLFLAAGGKRLRPLLCACGWHAASGGTETPGLVAAGAALEMFHAFALIHDDVMDRSATRRGAPTIHCRLAGHFAATYPPAQAEQLGISAAILIGDLALTWSDQLLHEARLAPGTLARALDLIDAMRTEIMYGQYLDLIAAAQTGAGLEAPLAVIRYKTAKYSIERPLQLGAILAGADTGLTEALSTFAVPLGEAYQLRDDLLGVFGVPCETGKSRLDDLREGKRTVLIALALAAADPGQRTVLHAALGNQALTEPEAERAREVLTAVGAGAWVEQMIEDRYGQALAALDQMALPGPADQALRTLARLAVWRQA